MAAPPIRRVFLVGRETGSLVEEFAAAGIAVADAPQDADAIVCHGGDGTLIGAERDHPGVPKVPVRPDARYIKCARHQNAALFGRLARGEQSVTRLPLLEARVGERRLIAVNDVVLHNAKVTSAVRYRVWIDGAPYSDVIVGDGLVASTPFGSTAYYRSITNSVIRVGLGLAFNNSTEAVNHLVLNEDALVEVEIERGPAVLVDDNNLEPVPLGEGDRIAIRFSGGHATIFELETLLCMDCRQRATGRPAGSLHVR
ncbi:MAG: hypothetical protein SF028_04570 [Candidatus Sumerlaeia bacterium]|nr:hypothetical protein [Candidatus Sumerlaeia bacterium]